MIRSTIQERMQSQEEQERQLLANYEQASRAYALAAAELEQAPRESFAVQLTHADRAREVLALARASLDTYRGARRAAGA